MLIEVDSKVYKKFFENDSHPFITEKFIDFNEKKVERVVRLINSNEKPVIGLIAGIKGGILKSPFSAPFGGFHYRNEVIYESSIDNFLISLKEYVKLLSLKRVEINLPPDLYHQTINAKTVNSLLRNGFRSDLPEITNWVDLRQFIGEFSQKNSREYYRQAVRNKLEFAEVFDDTSKFEVYDLIVENRTKFNRPIYMTFNEVKEMEGLWPVDFFKVISFEGNIVASAIFYRFAKDICYAVFWGDNDQGRPLRAMDFMVFNLWSHYKDIGYKYIDLGISTESGWPNEGLLRFKESHEAISSLRYRFCWSPEMNNNVCN